MTRQGHIKGGGIGSRPCACGKGCGKILPPHSSPGRPPSIAFDCPHRGKNNRRRDTANALAQGDPAKAAALAQATGLVPRGDAGLSSTIRRLALAIRTNRGDEQAAALEAGLAEDPRLPDLLRAAREKYKDLIEDRPGAVAKVSEEMALGLLIKVDDPLLSGQQAASAFAALAQGTERMNQGARKAWSNVYVVVPGLTTVEGFLEPATVGGRKPGNSPELSDGRGDSRGHRRRRAKTPPAEAKGRGVKGYWRGPRAE